MPNPWIKFLSTRGIAPSAPTFQIRLHLQALGTSGLRIPPRSDSLLKVLRGFDQKFEFRDPAALSVVSPSSTHTPQIHSSPIPLQFIPFSCLMPIYGSWTTVQGTRAL